MTGPMSDSSPPSLREAIIAALRSVHDPEIPVNIYDLGLIYSLEISEACDIAIRMTLTTPNCPVAELMPETVRKQVAAVDGVRDVRVDLTWEPRWTRERMSADARLALDMMGIQWTDSDQPPRPRVTPLTFRRSGDDAAAPG